MKGSMGELTEQQILYVLAAIRGITRGKLETLGIKSTKEKRTNGHTSRTTTS